MASAAFEVMLSSQMLMILIDVIFNSATTILYQQNTLLLLLYILQDTCIVLSLILLVITFSSTFVFQAGLISLLLTRFASTLLLSVLYLVLSICLHVYNLVGRFVNLSNNIFNHEQRLRWDAKGEHVWNYGLGALFVIHKLVAALYYAWMKRTALLLSDPRLRGDTKWLRNLVRNS